jgi:hypothetical protein
MADMRMVSQHYTASSGILARPAATVASGVNPPEERPSVSADAADRWT